MAKFAGELRGWSFDEERAAFAVDGNVARFRVPGLV